MSPAEFYRKHPEFMGDGDLKPVHLSLNTNVGDEGDTTFLDLVEGGDDPADLFDADILAAELAAEYGEEEETIAPEPEAQADAWDWL